MKTVTTSNVRYSTADTASFFADYFGAVGFTEPQTFDFSWPVPLAGFAWRTARRTDPTDTSGFQMGRVEQGGTEVYPTVRPEPEQVLASHIVEPSGKRGRGRPAAPKPTGSRLTYPLAETPALHRTFAALDPNDLPALAEFAGEHGSLGESDRRAGERVTLYASPPPADVLEQIPEPNRALLKKYASGELKMEVGAYRTGWERWVDLLQLPGAEPHTAWVEHIDEMRSAVRVYDAVASRDPQVLAEHVSCRELRDEGLDRSYSHGWFVRYGGREVLMGRSKWRATEQGAFVFARHFLMWRVSAMLDKRVRFVLAEHPSSAQPTLRPHPVSLVGAMWLQLANAIAAEKSYRTCRMCGGWFEAGGVDDARKIFCSEGCKSKDYRRRRDLVKRLAADGQTVEEIGEQLAASGTDTDAETIRKWVAA